MKLIFGFPQIILYHSSNRISLYQWIGVLSLIQTTPLTITLPRLARLAIIIIIGDKFANSLMLTLQTLWSVVIWTSVTLYFIILYHSSNRISLYQWIGVLSLIQTTPLTITLPRLARLAIIIIIGDKFANSLMLTLQTLWSVVIWTSVTLYFIGLGSLT